MACGRFKHTPGSRCCEGCCCVREIDLVLPEIFIARVPVVNVDNYKTTLGELSVDHCVYKPSEYLNAGGLDYVADAVLLERTFARMFYGDFSILNFFDRWQRGDQLWLQAWAVLDFELEIQRASDGTQRVKFQIEGRNMLFVGGKTGFRDTIRQSNCSIVTDSTLDPGFDGWNPSYIAQSPTQAGECFNASAPELRLFGNRAKLQTTFDEVFYSEWEEGNCETAPRLAFFEYELAEWEAFNSNNNCKIPISITDTHNSFRLGCNQLLTTMTPTYPSPGAEIIFADTLQAKLIYCGDPDIPLEPEPEPEPEEEIG